MGEAVDYFTNHRNKMRFPWALYHRPIVDALRTTLSRVPGKSVLNLGSGPFFELSSLGQLKQELTLADIDARAIELARELHGDKIHATSVIYPDKPLPFDDESFDLIVSMDVIEHVPLPEPWLNDVMRVLRPGGTLFLTTPNYASLSLKFIENTALEVIARLQGFSRQGLHPSKMTEERLGELLTRAGCTQIEMRLISLGWVLTATAQKTEPPQAR